MEITFNNTRKQTLKYLVKKNNFPEYKYLIPEDYSDLAEIYPKHFHDWFDKDKFPEKYLYCLAKHCPEHFDIWFDKDKFSEKFFFHLAKYCTEQFNVWFNKETYPKDKYWILTAYCEDYEHIWNGL